jgi:hypothetical protein
MVAAPSMTSAHTNPVLLGFAIPLCRPWRSTNSPTAVGQGPRSRLPPPPVPFRPATCSRTTTAGRTLPFRFGARNRPHRDPLAAPASISAVPVRCAAPPAVARPDQRREGIGKPGVFILDTLPRSHVLAQRAVQHRPKNCRHPPREALSCVLQLRAVGLPPLCRDSRHAPPGGARRNRPA